MPTARRGPRAVLASLAGFWRVQNASMRPIKTRRNRNPTQVSNRAAAGFLRRWTRLKHSRNLKPETTADRQSARGSPLGVEGRPQAPPPYGPAGARVLPGEPFPMTVWDALMVFGFVTFQKNMCNLPFSGRSQPVQARAATDYCTRLTRR